MSSIDPVFKERLSIIEKRSSACDEIRIAANIIALIAVIVSAGTWGFARYLIPDYRLVGVHVPEGFSSQLEALQEQRRAGWMEPGASSKSGTEISNEFQNDIGEQSWNKAMVLLKSRQLTSAFQGIAGEYVEAQMQYQMGNKKRAAQLIDQIDYEITHGIPMAKGMRREVLLGLEASTRGKVVSSEAKEFEAASMDIVHILVAISNFFSFLSIFAATCAVIGLGFRNTLVARVKRVKTRLVSL